MTDPTLPVPRFDAPAAPEVDTAAESDVRTGPEFDVAVLGLGPAGRALAYCCARRGLRVVAIDPNPARPWRATYACWRDELPSWLPTDVIGRGVDAPVVRTDAATITVDRGYVVLDNAALREALALDAVTVITGSADHLHPEPAGGIRVDLDTGRSVRATRVLDARGLPISSDSGRPLPLQTAFGVVVARDVAAAVLGGADAVLMDWRSSGDERPGEPPSFLYAVPLPGDRVLLEETCLIGRPGPGIDRLRVRLRRRLQAVGVEPDRTGPDSAAPESGDSTEVIATETVRFAMVSADERPWRSDIAVAFGARGGLGHPATGYSVAAGLREAEAVARAIATGHDPVRALWPWRARLIHGTLARAATVLEDLDTARMQKFFGAFFAMPVARQRDFLSDRRHPGRVAAAMAAVFARVGPDLRPRLVRGVLSGEPPRTGP
ncbi:lycopene cyclase family protein [Millisia brevis]|uniref:lycopene cyclase family protein n=1 Tax=Millisia brevis TaxID=264148 RepID=UPI0009FDEF7D|nr:lycopene cyclase family protein [Millisia brevis]